MPGGSEPRRLPRFALHPLTLKAHQTKLRRRSFRNASLDKYLQLLPGASCARLLRPPTVPAIEERERGKNRKWAIPSSGSIELRRTTACGNVSAENDRTAG